MNRFLALIVMGTTCCAAMAQYADTLEYYDDGIAKKWELKVDVQPNVGSRGDDVEGYGLTEYEESLGFNLGVGYNFTSNWYAGVQSGWYYHWGGESNNMIPVMGDVVYRYNIGTKEKLSLFLEGRAGYLFGLNSDRELYKKLTNYSFPDHFYWDIQPGIYFRLLRNIDLRVSLGYGRTTPLGNKEQAYLDKINSRMGEDEPKVESIYAEKLHEVTLKLGFNFRGKPTTRSRNWTIEDELRELEKNAKRARRDAERAVRDAERASGRLSEFDKRYFGTKDMQLMLYSAIDNLYRLDSVDHELRLLGRWAQLPEGKKIFVRAYIEEGKDSHSKTSAAHYRAKYLRQILIEEYNIPEKMISDEIFLVNKETAGKFDIDNRVDIYVQGPYLNFEGKEVRRPSDWNDDIERAYLEGTANEYRDKVVRLEARAKEAQKRVDEAEAEFEKIVQQQAKKEKDHTLFYIIENVDEIPENDPKLVEVARWAKLHPGCKVILKSYIEDDGYASVFAKAARDRMKRVKNLLVSKYGVRRGMIKSDVYVVSYRTARENDISRRVDIYTKQ